MTVNLKVYKQGREVLVAAADAEIVGKTLSEGKLQLEVKESFYGTEPADERTLVTHLQACTIANLVGEAAVAIAIANGFVDPGHVLEIEGVPYAQMATLT